MTISTNQFIDYTATTAKRILDAQFGARHVIEFHVKNIQPNPKAVAIQVTVLNLEPTEVRAGILELDVTGSRFTFTPEGEDKPLVENALFSTLDMAPVLNFLGHTTEATFQPTEELKLVLTELAAVEMISLGVRQAAKNVALTETGNHYLQWEINGKVFVAQVSRDKYLKIDFEVNGEWITHQIRLDEKDDKGFYNPNLKRVKGTLISLLTDLRS